MNAIKEVEKLLKGGRGRYLGSGKLGDFKQN
jgi:hypothetical protein